MNMITNVFFFLFCARVIAQFYKHAYALYPVYFILMGTSIVGFLCFLAFIADPKCSLIHLSTRSGDGRNKLISAPVEPVVFLYTEVSMTTITITGVLCLFLWLKQGIISGCHAYIIPMLKDLNTIEMKLWAKEEDLRSRVPPAAHTSVTA